MFTRPLTIKIEKPNVGQVIWALITLVVMLDLVFAGFAPDWAAKDLAGWFHMNVHDMNMVLIGVSFGAAGMALAFCFMSNQVSVPLAVVEHHRWTAVGVAVLLVVGGVILNVPALAAFFEKLDLAWVLLIVVGIILALVAIFRWPKRS